MEFSNIIAAAIVNLRLKNTSEKESVTKNNLEVFEVYFNDYIRDKTKDEIRENANILGYDSFVGGGHTRFYWCYDELDSCKITPESWLKIIMYTMFLSDSVGLFRDGIKSEHFIDDMKALKRCDEVYKTRLEVASEREVALLAREKALSKREAEFKKRENQLEQDYEKRVSNYEKNVEERERRLEANYHILNARELRISERESSLGRFN